ncbi:hypothetical protein ACJ6WH_07520 [Stenotrophomonas maltophilia]|uniref:hypothetical protein n=1 Tax=Stenotrophomonas maltophilia TaxID=40324 RepID=UPI003896D654
MPGSAGRWPATALIPPHRDTGQRPALPLDSFPREAWQGVHRLFQPLQMQQVFRAVAEALG